MWAQSNTEGDGVCDSPHVLRLFGKWGRSCQVNTLENHLTHLSFGWFSAQTTRRCPTLPVCISPAGRRASGRGRASSCSDKLFPFGRTAVIRSNAIGRNSACVMGWGLSSAGTPAALCWVPLEGGYAVGLSPPGRCSLNRVCEETDAFGGFPLPPVCRLLGNGSQSSVIHYSKCVLELPRQIVISSYTFVISTWVDTLLKRLGIRLFSFWLLLWTNT